jgi:uncharacterized membrane protein YfcA
MDFPVCGQHLNPYVLVAVGFVIGVLGGFFGVGGSFIAGPSMFAMGIPMNFVVGTDLAHIVGKSIVATKTHRALGNVDVRLASAMIPPTIIGSEIGARLIELLKKRAQVDVFVGGTFFVILIGIGGFMAWESWQTMRREKRKGAATPADAGAAPAEPAKRDETTASGFAERLRKFRFGPTMDLPQSGINAMPIWLIAGVGMVGGFFSGFLGGGAGYIRMPAMVYLLGIPTHVAVGTDLFEIVVSASYGTLTHALKGNVDILVALVMHTGAAIGAQIGAISTQFIGGPKIRLAFVPLPLIGAALLIYNLLSGHRGH